MLDGQIADATASVEHAGRGKGIRRAGVEAGRARAAMKPGMGRVGRQFEIEEQRSEKEITTAMLVDEHRVFADPAEPRSPREIAALTAARYPRPLVRDTLADKSGPSTEVLSA